MSAEEQQPRSRRLLSTVGSCLVVGTATSVLTVTLWLLLATLAPKAFDGWETVTITSGSMAPKVKVGDAVVIRTGSKEILPGRLMAFHDPAQPGRVLTHRLVRVNEQGLLITKGDANAQEDTTPVPVDNVIGYGRLVVPWGGYPAYWLAAGHYAPLGGLLAVVALSLVILCWSPDQPEDKPAPEPVAATV